MGGDSGDGNDAVVFVVMTGMVVNEVVMVLGLVVLIVIVMVLEAVNVMVVAVNGLMV